MENIVGNINDKTSIFFSSVGFTICVFVFMLILTIIYANKRKNGAKISMLFFILMSMVFIPLVFEIGANAIAAFVPASFAPKKIIYNILIRCYIIFSMYWIAIYGYYVVLLVLNRIKNKLVDEKQASSQRMLVYTITIILCIIAGVIIPYDLILTGPQGALVVTGFAGLFLNIEFCLVYIFMFGILVLNRKKFDDFSFLPYILIFFLYLILSILSVFFGYYSNNLCSFFGFLVAIIFFTIESQDTLILENYKKFKSDQEANLKKRQEFLVNISYQVRTPMHNIVGYGELVDDKYNLSIDDANVISKDIKNSVTSLKGILQSIIDISKLQKNQVNVNQVNYDSRVLIGNINSYVLGNKLKDNLNFALSSDQNIPINLYGDYEKVFYIITRILDNSIYTTDYGEVKLEILNKTLDSEYVELSFVISNSGHVMTEEMYNKNFEDYISNKDDINPVKIGLTIAKSYIDLLGGDIEFVNKEGQGTKYFIKLRQKIVNTTSSSIEQ